MEEPVEEELHQKEEFSGQVEGIRSLTLQAAKDLLKGKSFDDVFSCYVKSTVEHLIERVVDPFVEFSKREAEERIEPIQVPVGRFNIFHRFFCLPLTGVVDVGEGQISNLSALSKSDECVVDVQGRVLFVRLKFHISNVAYHADSTLALFCSNSTFNLKALLASIFLNVELCVDFQSLSNISAEVSKFEFDVSGFELGVTGDAIPELLAATIKYFYVRKYKDELQNLSLEKLKECMKSAVKKLLPLLNQTDT